VVLAIVGLIGLNLVLVLIAIFVYMGASAERMRVQTESTLRGIPILRFMNDRLGEARAEEAASTVAQRLLEERQVGARVVDGAGQGDLGPRGTLGVVTVSDLARELARGESGADVRAAMRPDLPTVHAEDDASRAIDLISSRRADAVVVLDRDDRILGVVTPAEVQRAMSLLDALRESGPTRH
jgi:predicted transcriptional regulator